MTPLPSPPHPGRSGSVMVGLILAMVMMAALGAAMLSLTGTAVINPVDAIRTAQARYLAEAGVRYVESLFRHPDDLNADGVTDEADINLRFESVHNQARVLRDGQGRFDIQLLPFFVAANAGYPAGSTDLIGRFPGGHRPAGQASGFTIPSSGRLKIGADYHDFTNHSYDPGTGQVRFTLANPLNRLLAKDRRILFAARAAGGTLATDPAGGSYGALSLDSMGDASVFPLKNGMFTIDAIAGTFGYQTRSGTSLQHITDRDNPQRRFSLTVAAGQKIALEPFVDIIATGTDGQGPEAVRHQTVFHVPLPTQQRVQVSDSFDNLSRWQAGSLGSHAIETIGGDKALRVVGTAAGPGGAQAMSQIAFNPNAVNLDWSAYQQQAGRFLSYDSQVKVGFVTSALPPVQGYDALLGQGPPVPAYYVGGLSFRLSDATADATFLALSFLRGDNAIDDKIPAQIVPKDGKPLIVLWQQKAGGVRNWLAYKELTERGFKDDVEAGGEVWTKSGLWDISTHRQKAGSGHNWYYGTGDYNTDGINSGELVSPDINLSGASSALLTYWSYHQTEKQRPDTFDLKTVEVSTDGGATWPTILETVQGENISDDSICSGGCNFKDWHQRNVSLSAFLGRIIKIRFRFNTMDANYNDYEGWYIDDVNVKVTLPDNHYVSALAVRLIEGASVVFTNGGPAEIKDGDIISQGAGVQARVKGDPILTAGNWTAANAAGVIVLKNVTAPFVAGEPFAVVGSATTGSVAAYGPKDNYIRAYYGHFDTTDSGTANDVATDVNKRGNPRGQINWPPDTLSGWAGSTDYFRQVRWDVVNTAEVDTLTRLVSKNAEGGEKEVVVKTAEPTFLTPDIGLVTQPEFGLHTLGDGSANIFFDDFALQLDAHAKKGFAHTIQE